MVKISTINLLVLKETTYQKPTGLYGVVERCCMCGDKHIHSAEEGHVVGHCINRQTSYELVIDRDNTENVRLAEKYGINL